MTETNSFPIVGIGASAGGIEALEGLFKGLPADAGMAYVVVTHLSNERESLLHEIVARYTDMRVVIARDGDEVEVNTVIVVPGNAMLGLEEDRLRITRPETGRRERKPIDIFFSSLALAREELAIGIILSGGDGDGTLGMKAIKQHGGLTFAQLSDAYGPSHPDMPNSAITSGFVDFAVTATDMGPKLVEVTRPQSLTGLELGTNFDADDADLKKASQQIYLILRVGFHAELSRLGA